MNLIPLQNTIMPDGRDCYHEVDRGSDTLGITVGDSWTWGDSLGKTTFKYDDYDYRTKHIYGAYMSKELNADFINLGFCGLDNMYIMLAFKKIFAQLTRKYKKCYVFFTLTESGRELNGSFINQQSHYNEIKGDNWPTYKSIIAQTATAESIDFARNEMINQGIDFVYHFDLIIELLKSTSLTDFFIRYEAWTFRNIYQIFSQLDVDWKIARNFTSVKKENYFVLPSKNLITKRWVDVISECGSIDMYPNDVDVVSVIGLDPIIKTSKSLRLDSDRQEWIDMLEKSNQSINWLLGSPYNSRSATKHPLEQAHKWWAEYLLETIK